jgi:hypothetical protein
VFFFSPDGKHVAYAGIKDGKKVVILDQSVERSVEYNVCGILFSPDVSRIAVVTGSGEEHFPYRVSYNGRSFSVSRNFSITTGFRFNSDGTHLAAVMHNTIIVDGIPGPVFGSVASVNFLGNRLQYVARTGMAGGSSNPSKYYLVEEELSPLEKDSQDKNGAGSKD